MSRRSIVFSAGLIALGITIGAIAGVAGADSPVQAIPAQRAATVIDAPGVRAAAFVAPDASYLRRKGFRKITQPFTGTYCLQLPKGMDPGQVLPIVSPEYYLSPGSKPSAEWDASGDDCGALAKSVEVETLDDNGFSASVAFTIVVP